MDNNKIKTRQKDVADKVLFEELTPKEFRKKLADAPVAYLPLGTIEWHGEHLPLGADGLQSKHFFELLAKEAGGIVFPMFFLGPDKQLGHDGKEYYGMDIGNFVEGEQYAYECQQFDGSTYWISDSLFHQMIDATMKQISRSGFKLVVAHGHGPSTNYVNKITPELEEKYNIKIINCWGSNDEEGKGIMVDHAAMNETSLTWALRPELVQMENLNPDTNVWPLGVGGKDPREFASKELGEEIVQVQLKRMSEKVKEELSKIRD